MGFEPMERGAGIIPLQVLEEHRLKSLAFAEPRRWREDILLSWTERHAAKLKSVGQASNAAQAQTFAS